MAISRCGGAGLWRADQAHLLQDLRRAPSAIGRRCESPVLGGRDGAQHPEGQQQITERIKALFEAVKQDRDFRDAFRPGDELELQPKALAWVAGELARYDFLTPRSTSRAWPTRPWSRRR